MRRHFAAAAQYFRAIRRGTPRYLILHVLTACDARCRMCCTAAPRPQARMAPPLTLAQIDLLTRSMGPIPQLTLSGGEPLLREDVHRIIGLFYEQAGTRFITVPTNALHPERVMRLMREFVALCPWGFLNLCLPLHGGEALHDATMGVPGSYAQLCLTYAAITRFCRSHPNVSCVLNCVVSAFNQAKYREIVELAESRFPAAPLAIAYARPPYRDSTAGEFPITAYQAMHAWRRTGMRARGGRNPYTRIQDAIAGQHCAAVTAVATGQRSNVVCCAGTHLVVIYANGDVYPCEPLAASGAYRCAVPPPPGGLGNLHDFNCNLAHLLESEQACTLLNWRAGTACACTWECALTSEILHTGIGLARLGAHTAAGMVRSLLP